MRLYLSLSIRSEACSSKIGSCLQNHFSRLCLTLRFCIFFVSDGLDLWHRFPESLSVEGRFDADVFGVQLEICLLCRWFNALVGCLSSAHSPNCIVSRIANVLDTSAFHSRE